MATESDEIINNNLNLSKNSNNSSNSKLTDTSTKNQNGNMNLMMKAQSAVTESGHRGSNENVNSNKHRGKLKNINNKYKKKNRVLCGSILVVDYFNRLICFLNLKDKY